ncbi:36114_t:CDS:2, partial [Racocetra persica]
MTIKAYGFIINLQLENVYSCMTVKTSNKIASYKFVFRGDNQNNNTITYCKICIRELEELDEVDGIQASPYHITNQEKPIIITNQEINSDLDLPSLSPEKQQELTKLVI